MPESADKLDLQRETALKGTVESETGRWNYKITTYTVTGEHYAADDPDRLLVRHSYQTAVMEVSAAAKEGRQETLTEGEAAALAFNSCFEERLQDEVDWFEEMATIAEEDYAARLLENGSDEASPVYSDETILEFWTGGNLLCVTSAENSYTGGAHGSYWRTTVSFDLRTGKQITLTELVSDESGLRRTVTEELARQMEERQAGEDGSLFFEDCGETLNDWMSRETAFCDEGLQVIFGVYDLGPYAVGEQVFTVPYELVEPWLNSYGRELLGR